MTTYKIEFPTWKGSKEIKRTRTVSADTQDAAIELAQADMIAEFGRKLHVNYVFQKADKKPAIKKDDWKESLPADVFSHLQDIISGQRNANFEYHPEGDTLYLAEGASYQIRTTAGQWNRLQMQSEFSLHAGGGAASHAIGEQIASPVGTWIIETEYFLSKKIVTVHHWGLRALA